MTGMDDGRALAVAPVYRIRPVTLLDLQSLAAPAGVPELGRDGGLGRLVMFPGWTMTRDGLPIAAAGYVPIWSGRAAAWFLGAPIRRGDWVAITRAIAERLGNVMAWQEIRRLEISVKDGHAAGHRWARKLGFACETERPLEAYLPDGGDGWVYSIVKNGAGPLRDPVEVVLRRGPVHPATQERAGAASEHGGTEA